MRHIGLKVDDVDRWAERVRAAGAPLTIEPEDAFGGVRLCFFLDPDGTHLEFIAGTVDYTTVGSPGLVDRERATPVPASPRFDHVAVSVTELDRALAFYTGHLGFPILGQLREDNPARGFTITYLQAGPGVLEVFSFTAPMLANSFDPAAPAPGLLYLGLGAGDVSAAAARLQAAGGALLAGAGDHGPDSALVTDADGTPLEVNPAPPPALTR
jgi:catechol 2,3-dioxygenase-like lactoylglutathione lyase family enzyme